MWQGCDRRRPDEVMVDDVADGRAARVADGADEAHKMVLTKFMREEGRDF